MLLILYHQVSTWLTRIPVSYFLIRQLLATPYRHFSRVPHSSTKETIKIEKLNHFKTIRIIQGRMAPHLFQEIQQSECSWMAAILPHDRQASYEVFDKALLIEKA